MTSTEGGEGGYEAEADDTVDASYGGAGGDDEMSEYLEWKMSKVDGEVRRLERRRSELTSLRESCGAGRRSSRGSVSRSGAPARPCYPPFVTPPARRSLPFSEASVPRQCESERRVARAGTRRCVAVEEEAEVPEVDARESQLQGELKTQLEEIHSVQDRIDRLRSLLSRTEETVREAQGARAKLVAATVVRPLEIGATELRRELEDMLSYSRVAFAHGRQPFSSLLFQRLLALGDAQLPAVCEGLLRALPLPMEDGVEKEQDGVEDVGDVTVDDDGFGREENVAQLAREHKQEIIGIEIVARKLDLFLVSLLEATTSPCKAGRVLTQRDCDALASFVTELVKANLSLADRTVLVSSIESAVAAHRGQNLSDCRESVVKEIDDLLYDDLLLREPADPSVPVALAPGSSTRSARVYIPVRDAADRARRTLRVPSATSPHRSRGRVASDLEDLRSDAEFSRAATKGSESPCSVSDAETLQEEGGGDEEDEEEQGETQGDTTVEDDFAESSCNAPGDGLREVVVSFVPDGDFKKDRMEKEIEVLQNMKKTASAYVPISPTRGLRQEKQ